MKKMKIYVLYIVIIVGMLSSCSDQWDEHYTQNDTKIESNEIVVISESLNDYLAKETSLASTYQMLNNAGLIEKMAKKNLSYTILAIEDGTLKANREVSNNDLYTAQTYVSDVTLAPSSIPNVNKLQMWNGKFLDVNLTTTEDNKNIITFNNATVTKIIKLNNGYLYIIDQAINAPRPLSEVIENLGENYSIFRELVLSKCERIFEKDKSPTIDIDQTGNTVYDSVFSIRAPYFEAKGLDIMSENISATVLIPSNQIITDAMNNAHERLAKWELQREDSIIRNWIVNVCFFNKVYTKEDFENTTDLNSIFHVNNSYNSVPITWRTTVQEVDLEHPINMSNGIAYYVTKMKIPTNVLVYRLKDKFESYEKLSDKEKATYFAGKNLAFSKTKEEVAPWSGWPQAGFPKLGNTVVYFKLADTSVSGQSFSMDLTPFKYISDGTKYEVKPYKIPAGTYKVSMGFKDSMKSKITISINGNKLKDISSFKSYHYDRQGGNSPEGFDKNNGTKNASKYDLDGTVIGTITIEEDGQPIIIHIEGTGDKSNDVLILHHWTLKPTADCY